MQKNHKTERKDKEERKKRRKKVLITKERAKEHIPSPRPIKQRATERSQ